MLGQSSPKRLQLSYDFEVTSPLKPQMTEHTICLDVLGLCDAQPMKKPVMELSSDEEGDVGSDEFLQANKLEKEGTKGVHNQLHAEPIQHDTSSLVLFKLLNSQLANPPFPPYVQHVSSHNPLPLTSEIFNPDESNVATGKMDSSNITPITSVPPLPLVSPHNGSSFEMADPMLQAEKVTGLLQPSGQSKKCPKLGVQHQMKTLAAFKKISTRSANVGMKTREKKKKGFFFKLSDMFNLKFCFTLCNV